MLSPIYQGTASSSRLNHVVASIYSFTEMHQNPPSRDTELHSLPPRDLLSLQLIEGNRQCIHTHTQTHAHTHARVREHSLREVSPAPSSGAILLLLDFSSWSILQALL